MTPKLLLNGFIFLLTFITVACLSPYAPVTEELANEQLIGEWKPTEESLDFLKKENENYAGLEIKLILSADNKFVLKNIPDCFRDNFGKCKGGYHSLNGKWKILVRNDSVKDLALYDESLNTTFAIPLSKKQGKLQIIFVFGDPDSGRAIYFTK